MGRHEYCSFSGADPSFPGANKTADVDRAHVNASIQTASEPFGYTREVFSVAGARVTLDGHHGWQCACTAGRVVSQCAHIEQAQVFRSRRGAKREEDTIELELSAEQLRALSEALATQAAQPPPPAEVSHPKRTVHRWDWTTLIAAAAVASLSSGITYFAVRGGEATSVIEHPIAAARTALVAPPAPPSEAEVQFVNPFDATEIFKFPSGTPETSVRDAVAELLLKRAHERLSAADELRRRFSEAHERDKRVASVAQGT